jgi:tRNA(Ile)-lysidine synthase
VNTLSPTPFLVVAHVNHGWRGAESDADEVFVAALAESLNLPAETVRLRSEQTEVAARTARYEWLATLANQLNATWVATAHTLDDQAETVLHRLIRGSGIQGLRGIAADRPFAFRSRLVRPLLHVTRVQILDYLESIQQPFRIDSSNANPIYTRNRIRAEVLPLLRTFNPDIAASLARIADQAEETFATLEAEASELVARLELPRTDRLVFRADELAVIVDHRLREVFRFVWQREGWPLTNMDAAAWQRTVRVAKGIDSACDFPGGVRMQHRGRVVHLRRDS